MKQLFTVLFFLLLFVGSAEAVVRYADGQLVGNCTSGNYSITNRDCSGSDGDAYGGDMGLENAAEASSDGDTVRIRKFNGVYIGGGDHAGNQSINLKPGSNINNRITYEGWGDGCAALSTSIGGANSNCPTIGRRFHDVNGGMHFLVLKLVIVDGINAGQPGDGSLGQMNNGGEGVRFESIEVKNFSATAMSHFSNTEFINVHLHHNGIRSTQAGTVSQDCSDGSGGGGNCHGIYSPGPNMVYDGGSYHDNPGGAAGIDILCYPGPCSNNTFKNLTVQAFFCHGGSGNLMYNIVALEDFGPQCGGSVYHLTTPASVLSSGGNTLRNIIALGGISGRTGSGAIVDPATINITISHSICPTNTWPSSPNYCVSASSSSLFTNAPAGDYSLKSGAVAIDSGICVAAVTKDILGTDRPQGFGCDKGAYEFIEGGPPNQPPVVNITGPTSNPTHPTSSDTITVSGTASDSDGSVSSMSCNNDRTGSCSVSGLTSWTAFDVPLLPGENVITITATDNDNDGGNDVITVTYTPAQNNEKILELAMNEPSGTTVDDTSGKNNDGTISLATRTASGKYGSAVAFDGTGDVITIPHNSSLTVTSGVTVSMWVFPTQVNTDWRSLGDKGENWFIWASSTGPCGTNMVSAGFVTGAGLRTVCHSTPLQANVWTYVTMTYDQTTLKLYFNGGTPVASAAFSEAMAGNTGVVRLGNNVVGTEGFIGRIDEPRIYNYALNQAAIEADMNDAIDDPPLGTPRNVRFGAGFKASGTVKFGFAP